MVRIVGRGTGFFVAPALILTCAHLFDDGATSTDISWRGQKGTAEIVRKLRTPEIREGPDLALLRITWQDGKKLDHPCVMLAEDAVLKDSFYVFGHPGGKFEAGGDSVREEYRGTSRDEFGTEYIRTAGDNAESGFSGSPVLNERTKQVCGVLAINLNPNAAEGARFLPIRYAMRGFPELAEEQRHFHEQDPTWTSFLPGTQLWADVWRHAHKSVITFEKVFGPEANHRVPFVERAIEKNFASFVQSPRSAMVIIGQSGMGKTTVIQRLLEKYEMADANLCAVFESATLPSTIVEAEHRVLERLGRSESTAQEFFAKISPECVRRKKYLIIFVDAVNEYNSRLNKGKNEYDSNDPKDDPTNLLNKLDGLISGAYEEYPNIKFVITCRPETWRRALENARSMFEENKQAYYVGPGGIAHELPPFSEEEMELAYEEYRKGRNISTAFTKLTPLAKYQLRDPLLLSLASEVYSNREIPDDLDTGEVFDQYYLRLKTSQEVIEGIVAEFFARSDEDQRSDQIIRTAIVRDNSLRSRNGQLYEDLDITNSDRVGFQLKKQKVLREWTVQPEENLQANRRDIQIRFTYDRFAEYLLARELMKRIEQRAQSNDSLESATIAVISENLLSAQQMVIVFGALRRLVLAMQKRLHNYAALLVGITQSDPRALSLVTSVLARIARSEDGLEVTARLLKRFEKSIRLNNGTYTRFPLIDVAYRLLKDQEYRHWLDSHPEKQGRHLGLLYSYFLWGLQHYDEKISANAIQYLFFLWRSEEKIPRADAIEITNRTADLFKHVSVFSYLLHWEQKRLLGNMWGLLVLVLGEMPQDDVSQEALSAIRKIIGRLRLKKSTAFRSIVFLTGFLTRLLKKIMGSLGQPVRLAALDAFYAPEGHQDRLGDFVEAMGFFTPATTLDHLRNRAGKLSQSENGFTLQMLTFALSVCYERQEDADGRQKCLAMLRDLFFSTGAKPTSRYCASLALYHINYFGSRGCEESLALMGQMADVILKEHKGRFELIGKQKESFNIIGTYGRALNKQGEVRRDGTGKGTTKRALHYAIDALEQAKSQNDFEYYHFVCENIGLLGVLIEPVQVLDLIATVLADFPTAPAMPYRTSFTDKQMSQARETVLMSLANIRVLYRQEVDRFLLEELESPTLYDEVANQRIPQFTLATFYSWAVEQLTFRILTKYYEQIGDRVVDIFVECARSGSTANCLATVVERMVGLVNEYAQ